MTTQPKKVPTNSSRNSTTQITVNRKNRIIAWGGAYSKSDNHTFLDTANNLQRAYKNKDGSKYNIFVREIKTKDDFIDLINRQPENSIRSLDIFTHGGEDSLYMVSVRQSDSWSPSQYRLWRYAFHNKTFSSSDLSSLQYKTFTQNAKIEIHGCQTAANPQAANNLASEWSKKLYSAGKTQSSVMGHTTNASPLINGSKTTSSEQSYMWQQRVAYRNGRIILDTTEKGLIDEVKLSK
ncbi:hypothetical protein F3J02_12310 [Acinetobacter sp. Tr-809]|uniref:hypothetical protein n=1 Tax=Acinetobacter sp. Tr-809 TaxID=2608324 RepID=UPI00141FAD3F|nr:hypothetical protein [Acinetobacter sp. Tr-809]NIE97253.1 hypothetical protein [Acinetobacter sp. Tr-809]